MRYQTALHLEIKEPRITSGLWLWNRDSNPNKQSQSLSCYRYTIPQYIRSVIIITQFSALSSIFFKTAAFFIFYFKIKAFLKAATSKALIMLSSTISASALQSSVITASDSAFSFFILIKSLHNRYYPYVYVDGIHLCLKVLTGRAAAAPM